MPPVAEANEISRGELNRADHLEVLIVDSRQARLRSGPGSMALATRPEPVLALAGDDPSRDARIGRRRGLTWLRQA